MVRLVPLLLLAALVGCAEKIGDSCSVSNDCSSGGDRICDRLSPKGYCTIFGCDHDTCPEEAVCVRFFSVGNATRSCDSSNPCVAPEVCSPAGGCVPPSTRTCDPATEDRSTDTCSPDEACTLAGVCVPKSAEMRFCMKKCSKDGNCRAEYECRNQEIMKVHGGEPVPKPNQVLGAALQGFCAVR